MKEGMPNFEKSPFQPGDKVRIRREVLDELPEDFDSDTEYVVLEANDGDAEGKPFAWLAPASMDPRDIAEFNPQHMEERMAEYTIGKYANVLPLRTDYLERDKRGMQ